MTKFSAVGLYEETLKRVLFIEGVVQSFGIAVSSKNFLSFMGELPLSALIFKVSIFTADQQICFQGIVTVKTTSILLFIHYFVMLISDLR